MSDVATAEVTEPTEAPVKAPLTVEEYERRNAAQARDLREQRQEIASLRELIQMKGAEPTTRAEKAEVPDPEVDPIAYLKYAKSRLEGFDAAEELAIKRQKEQQTQNANVQQIATRMEEYERDFAESHPDYYGDDGAAAHYRKARTVELREEGFTGSELDNQLRMEMINVVGRAIRAGKDPAEVVYKLAKNRGFGVDGDGKKLQTITRAQEAGKSLSTTGGRSGDGELTYEYVSSLKGKAFSEAFAKLKAQAKEAERRAR